MGFDPGEPEQRNRLKDFLAAADITVPELWLHYFSLSGSADEFEVDAYLQGLISLPVTYRDLLALAANELMGEPGGLHAPYAYELNAPGAGSAV
ncbi:MAG: hypothetical protein HOQ06_00230 [Pseudarthrobacter sp.]|nr:hypothetical protein [Pseudarthrobacter sp.]